MFSATTINSRLYSRYIPGLYTRLLFDLKKLKPTAIWQSRQEVVYMVREGGREFIGYGRGVG